MTLQEYLKENGISPERFAKKINVSGQAVRYWILGKRHPSPKNIRTIQNLTDNQIKPESWY